MGCHSNLRRGFFVINSLPYSSVSLRQRPQDRVRRSFRFDCNSCPISGFKRPQVDPAYPSATYSVPCISLSIYQHDPGCDRRSRVEGLENRGRCQEITWSISAQFGPVIYENYQGTSECSRHSFSVLITLRAWRFRISTSRGSGEIYDSKPPNVVSFGRPPERT